jgi:hypothetical protein
VVVASGDQPVVVDAVRVLGLFGGLMLQRQQLAARVATLEGDPETAAVITAAAAGVPATEGSKDGLSRDEDLDAWISDLEQESKRTREGAVEGPDLPEESLRPWVESEDEQEVPNLARSFTAEGVADLKPEDLGLSPAEFERLMGKAAVDWRHSAGEVVRAVDPDAEAVSPVETDSGVEDPAEPTAIDSGYGDAGSADESVGWRVSASEETAEGSPEASPLLPVDPATIEEPLPGPGAPEPAKPVIPISDTSDEGESIRFWRVADDEEHPSVPAAETGGDLPGIDWAALVGEAAAPAGFAPEVEPPTETPVPGEAPDAEVPEGGSEAGEADAGVVEPESIPVSGELVDLSEDLTQAVELSDGNDLAAVSVAPESSVAPETDVEPVVESSSAPEAEVPGSAVAAVPADPAAAVGGLDQNAHNEARRFARLLVAEIRLYNERAVEEGSRQGDLYLRLRTDIDRSREMYEKRARPEVKQVADYFHQELVQSLAGGDAGLLGLDYPGSTL